MTARELRPPVVCFANPGQVHFWRCATGIEGRAILFTGEPVQRLALLKPSLDPLVGLQLEALLCT